MRRCLSLALVGAVLVWTPIAEAGKLREFEKDATSKKSSSSKGSSSRRHYNDDDDDDDHRGVGLPVHAYRGIGGIGEVLGAGLGRSFDRMSPPLRLIENNAAGTVTTEVRVVEARQPGAALIPILRMDLDYQYVDSDIEALGLHAEAGYGALAVQGRQTRFEEDNGDGLNVTTLAGLLRASMGDSVELDLALGAVQFDGEEEHWGFSVGTPILVHYNEHIGFEYRPTWSRINGNSIREGDLALLLGLDHLSLKIGYRTLRSPNLELDGPYAGVSVRW